MRQTDMPQPIKKFQFDTSDFEPYSGASNAGFSPDDFEPYSGANNSSFSPSSFERVNSQPQDFFEATQNMPTVQQSQDKRSFLDKLPRNMLAGAGNLIQSIVNTRANLGNASDNLVNGYMGKPQQSAPGQFNFDFGSALGLPQTVGDQFAQSFTKNIPSMVMPSLGADSFLLNAASRVGGQGLLGGLSNPQNPTEGAKEFAEGQGLMEGVGAGLRPIGMFAEKINPMQAAGAAAEKIRNLAHAGKAEADKYYAPVNEKYNDSWVTPTPEKYLGFKQEDTQYFKPDVNRAYRDFKAEPTFENLHNLQSVMGKYSELKPMRDDVKDRITGFLSQDAPMLESYQKGSNMMRDNYYPYTSNDVLQDIVEHQKPIKKYSPQQLQKGLNNAPLVDRSSKALTPIDHPLVKIADKFNNRMNQAQAWQYGVPSLAGAIAGHFIDPTLGSVLGASTGATFGKFGEPQLLKLAQNPSFLQGLKYLQNAMHGTGRQLIGYNMSSQ